jgi:hypothetical protein
LKGQSANLLPFALAFVLPASVYGLTLAPGLTWAHYGADGGDLVSAAHTLGVPHPPGYPTYTLLAWLFTRLPMGNVAWRVNLLSALSSAAAAVFICRAVVHLAAKAPRAPAIVAGLGAAWSYAFAPLVWGQALIAEVYALAGLWTAWVLEHGLSEWADGLRPGGEHGSAEWADGLRSGGKVDGAFALGLLWSLGLGVHLTLLFLAPLIAWLIFRRPSFVLRLASGFLIGLLVWLYLPLRDGLGWGQPATWQGFWWLVSGALYRGYVFALPPSALGGRLAAWAQTWLGGLGWTGVALALWGVMVLAGRRRGGLVALALCFVAWNLYALGYNTTDSVVYLVPAFVIGSVWLGVGLADVLGRVWDLGGRRWTPLLLALALLTPAWSLARNGAALDLSDDHEAADFCGAVMNEAPPGAILLTRTDRQTFALWYCQQVRGLRPDVAVVDEGLRNFDWYRVQLQRAHPNLWVRQAHDGVSPILSDDRPHCRVQREAQAGWLDCQNSN